MTTLPDVLIATHDQAQHAIGEQLAAALRPDTMPPGATPPSARRLAGALTLAIAVHTVQPSPTGRVNPDCEYCDGVGTIPSLNPATGEFREAHCHCRCPWCIGCDQPVCEGPCETICAVAAGLGLETL